MARSEKRSPPAQGDDTLAALMAEYFRRLREGESLDVESFAAEHPEHAGELRDLLPTLQALEDFGKSDPGGAASPFPEDTPPDRTLGDFRILREIGRGGMGVVYEAEQISLGRRVALKVLPFASVIDQRQTQRFRNEAQAAAQLHHEHIVPVFAVGIERGVHYYAMQYVEGQTLAEVIRELRKRSAQERQGSTPAKIADNGSAGDRTSSAFSGTSTHSRDFMHVVARLGIQVAGALDYAHEAGIVHRDVKPSNLMIDSSSKLWLTDFGLALIQGDSNLTLSGDVLGTIRYMSPEQALGKRGVVDQRSDVYSLGITLYELLTLRPAYDGTDREEILRRMAFEDPAPPRSINSSVSRELETIILRAITKSPEERYATAGEFGEDLQRFLDGRPVLARRPGVLKRAGKWMRRHPAISAFAGTLLLLLVTGGFLLHLRNEETLRQNEIRYKELVLDGVVKLQFAREARTGGMFDQGPWSHRVSWSDDTWAVPAQGAVDDLRESVGLFPQRAEARYHLAQALIFLGSEEEARSIIEGSTGSFVPALVLLEELRAREEPGGMQFKQSDVGEKALRPWERAWFRAHTASNKHWEGEAGKEAAEALGELIRELKGESHVGLEIEARIERGRQFLRLREYFSALEALTLVVAQWPEFVEPQLLKGRVYLELEEIERAEGIFRSLHEDAEFPDHVAEAIARIYRESKSNFWGWDRDYSRIEDKDDDWPERGRGLAWAERIEDPARRERNRAASLYQLVRFEESLRSARVAVTLEPDSATAHFHLARAHQSLGKLDAAIHHFDEVLEIEPENLIALDKRAHCIRRTLGVEVAIKDWEDYLRRRPTDPVAYYFFGRWCMGAQDNERAIDNFTRTIELNPRIEAAHYNLACAYSILAGKAVSVKDPSPSAASFEDYSARAIESLRTSLEQGFNVFDHIRKDPDLDPIRDLPEVKRLLEEAERKAGFLPGKEATPAAASPTGDEPGK